MSVSVHRRPAAVLAVAALLSAGLAAPASASPWSDAWTRLAVWFAQTPFGEFWADRAPRQIVGNEGGMVDPSGRPAQAVGGRAPRQVVGNEGVSADPNGRPAQAVNGGAPDRVPGND